MVKDENKFEMIFNEFGEDLTEKDLDRLLEYVIDINMKILTWRLGVFIPFGLATYQAIELLEKTPPTYFIIGGITLLIVWIFFGYDYFRYVKELDKIEFFKQYLTVKKKIVRPEK